MKWIAGIVFLIVGGLFFNGYYTAKQQLEKGVSLLEVAFTYNAMNPVSQYGYSWVMKNNNDLQRAVSRMNEATQKLNDASTD
ncbi:hypothetical protein [Pantoea coffeiphila]|uniref:hypothetical protein n=1 Tax=Pantoea coffeiphila TaxID=1465635 RepID=UPI0019617FC5|nr:hypothetical protein [Pantoea coffeiphila]MBM7341510.1 hypothetical protein [Pantoea coffeiphila]